jgi:hypothetical protein
MQELEQEGRGHFAIASYDTSFKYIMKDDAVRNSLISAFLFSGDRAVPSIPKF